MRHIIFLTAFFLLTGLVPAMAAPPVFCSPPNGGASCLTPANNRCSQIGMTTLDGDQKNLVACLATAAGNNCAAGQCQWKSMTNNDQPWTNLNLNTLSPFNRNCEYKVEFLSVSHDVYTPFTNSGQGNSVIMMHGVGPFGDLIGSAHVGVISGILHTNKKNWVWVNSNSVWDSIDGAIKFIYERCP